MSYKKPTLRIVDNSYNPDIDADKKMLAGLQLEMCEALEESIRHRQKYHDKTLSRSVRIAHKISLEISLHSCVVLQQVYDKIKNGEDYLKKED